MYGLVWLKLCWGKDMDHEKMENLCQMQPNRGKARINAINGKWIDWSRRKTFIVHEIQNIRTWDRKLQICREE